MRRSPAPTLISALLIFLSLLSLPAGAIPSSVHWEAKLAPQDIRAGEHAQIVLTAKIDAPWHLYSVHHLENGPIETTITLTPGNSLTADGKPIEPFPKVVFDQNFKQTVKSYEKAVAFGLPVRVSPGLTGAQTAKVSVYFQVCDKANCHLPETVELPVEFKVSPGSPRPEYSAINTKSPAQPTEYENYPDPTTVKPVGSSMSPEITSSSSTNPGAIDDSKAEIERQKKNGLFSFILFAFLAGFAALLTPCVFPMIPITVSFFAKHKEESGKLNIGGPLAYCLGIIGTFTGLGLLLTAFFGASGIRNLAANPWVNGFLALLFIVLAANLFGAFEIILPSWLVDKAQAGKKRGGLIGPMMMGIAFTLTSFTCTVAFVGTLLATAAAGGWFYPIVGMLAFSTAFSLPFFLLALFPQYLARLPKSGSWMISVKAFMGFLELAAALKFISNIDLFLNTKLITRPVFLAIWSAIGIIAGLYLIGWLRLAVDTTKKFGLMRKIIGVFSVMVGIYCLAAINGAPMGKLAGFLPPSQTHWITNYNEAIMKASAENKPIFINFSGAQCTNCRDMEANVLPLPEVKRELEKFVLVELYTDQRDPVSQANEKLMEKLTGVATLPVYVTMKPNGTTVTKVFQGSTSDVASFVRFIKKGYELR